MTIANKLLGQTPTEIEQIIKSAGLPTPEYWGYGLVTHGILGLVPTTYSTNSARIDSHQEQGGLLRYGRGIIVEQQAFILDHNGIILSQVQRGPPAPYNPGGESDRLGQSVKQALGQLGERAPSAVYVLLEETIQDDPTVTSAQKRKGAEPRGESGRKRRQLMLYELPPPTT